MRSQFPLVGFTLLNCFSYSFKINKLIYIVKQELFFLTEIRQKESALELNKRFVFQRAVDIELIIEFIQLIHDFLANDSSVRSPVYTFPICFA